MNNKILIGTIITICVLVGVSFTSVVGYRNLELYHKQIELIIDGPTYGLVGVSYNYSFNLTGQEGCEFYLCIDWDDGDIEDWIGPYESGEEVIISHAWYECGTYTILAGARASNGSFYNATLEVTIVNNQPPGAPRIKGPQMVTPGTHEYTFKAIEPDGDNVSYEIQWGDGDFTNWIGWYTSGEKIKRNHTYTAYGTVTILARAKDIHGVKGNWGGFRVEIPKSNQIINLLFLQSLNRFPLLNRIIMRFMEFGI